jgi:uncharacterized YigZ family protein
MSALRYAIPAARHRAETTIDRSRFLCTLSPASSPQEAQQFIREMNTEFPDATHNCWAYVIGAPGSTGQVGMSDDGEPHGTAGRPMLTVLLHSGVGDIAAVVTRWFGGTKLGTGGLVKAYSGAVQLALETMPQTVRVERVDCALTVEYSDISAMQQLWPQFEVEVLNERYETRVHYELRLPKEHVDALQAAVRNATRGQSHLVMDASAA